jgi:hypothetical protein
VAEHGKGIKGGSAPVAIGDRIQGLRERDGKASDSRSDLSSISGSIRYDDKRFARPMFGWAARNDPGVGCMQIPIHLFPALGATPSGPTMIRVARYIQARSLSIIQSTTDLASADLGPDSPWAEIQ